ncbi:hypothetical protein [Aureispira anguillae]|uniref:Uncharacterized protein n=1 Tax=Aureispira anguillae TaxID=2864201 RepID=A0A915YM07_9BACT|nr:hypothetical protein [Aureispira anguillae]BDS15406.1 hypothetical protein AsAng_0061900 [Aureispira anguillae]
MRITTNLIFLFCLLLQKFCSAQQDVHQAVIWRGFEHSWTYNHRINRLGNYIELNDNKIESCHASASGLGADSTFYSSHYTFIKSPTTGFYGGEVAIKLYGKEKQLLTKRIEVAVPAPEGMKNKEQYITMLNGFDLMAVERADKIQLLRITVEDAEYAPAINEIRFYLKVALVVNCQSLECSRFNQKTTYNLKVHYLIAAGDRSQLNATPKTLTKDYPWGRKDEFHHTAEKYYMLGRKGQDYQTAALGIKSMALTLNAAHWTVEYHNNVTPLIYNKETARLDFSLDLFFKEWQQGMKTQSARPGLSKFSSKKKGWCVLDTGIVLLEFKDAKILHQKHKGALYWEGLNATSSNPKAESRVTLKFPDF